MKTESTFLVLVIYELIPEELKIAKVPMTEEEYQHYKNASDYIINSSEDDGVKYNAVLDIDTNLANDGKWCEYIVSGDTNDLTNVDYMIMCGLSL